MCSVYEIAPPGGATLDLRELHTRFGMVLIVPQSGPSVLSAAPTNSASRSSAAPRWSVWRRTTTGDRRRRGRRRRARELRSRCDGAHSAVRRLLGIDFVGKQYETHILLADVRLASPPAETLFAKTGAEGVVLFIPFGDGWFRAIAWDRLREQAPLSEPVTLDEIRDAFRRIAGADLHGGDALELTVSVRAAAGQALSSRPGVSGRRRRARPLAARRTGHEHRHRRRDQPGLEAGRSDASRLRAALAAGHLREGERHPVGAGVLRLTDAFNQLVLGRSAVRRALRGYAIARSCGFREPPADRRTPQRIGIAYPRSRTTTGWWADDARYPTCDGKRVYELLRDGKFVLVTAAHVDIDRPDIVQAVDAKPDLPDAVLVRPDGYVAWASERLPTIRRAIGGHRSLVSGGRLRVASCSASDFDVSSWLSRNKPEGPKR